MSRKIPQDDPQTGLLGRRSFLIGASAIMLSGCVSTGQSLQPPRPVKKTAEPGPVRPRPAMYQAMPNEQFPIPAVGTNKVDPKFWRQEVDYPTDEVKGTVIVDTPNRYLYHVLGNGRAMRYGIGVGRDGFAWSGRAKIAYKREWPRWTPPDEMVARQPSLEPYSIANGGMAPGLKNPLGARAMYIHKDGRDTLYRIHGSPEAWSIGRAVSSGCIRLLNQDVIDLYNNVRDGSTIVVIPDTSKGQQVSS